jgi:hypothetical protein
MRTYPFVNNYAQLIDGLLVKRCQAIDSPSAFLFTSCLNIQQRVSAAILSRSSIALENIAQRCQPNTGWRPMLNAQSPGAGRAKLRLSRGLPLGLGYDVAHYGIG